MQATIFWGTFLRKIGYQVYLSVPLRKKHKENKLKKKKKKTHAKGSNSSLNFFDWNNHSNNKIKKN